MSAETIEWLNRYTLQSKAAWHTDAQLQKVNGTVYDAAIPPEDVATRLFGWEPLAGDVTSTATMLNSEGVETVSITDPERQTMIRPPRALSPEDTGAILGVFKSGYTPHSYSQWLIENVASILDDSLSIYSAGLLRGGAQAFVQVSVPDTITTPEGIEFRPNLLAVTSLDGSLATTYKRTITNSVCDNTMAAALGEVGQAYKVKHSRYSEVKLMEARDALQMVHTIADEFAAQVKVLCETTVTDTQFDAFLESIAPTKDAKSGELKTGRSGTMSANRHNAMRQLWQNDNRVTPWKGTAWGVLQAENTYVTHLQTVRGSERDERNMTLAVSGGFDKLANSTLETLQGVLTAA
jgi:phage/plasmid-like protein (TIGR03299 family)